MPAAAPIIATAALNAGAAAALGTTIFGLSIAASAAVIGVGSLALGLVSNALTPKPKAPSLNGMDGSRTIQVRQPVPPREVVYGELKKSGYLVLAENTEDNRYVHYVLTVAAHKVNALNTVYINDTPVFNDQIDGTGAVTAGKFAGKLWIKKHLGDDNQAADADLIAAISGLDSNFRLRGTAYLYVKHETDRDLFPNGANIAVRMQGKVLYDPRTDTERWDTSPALIWRDYKTNLRYGAKESTSRIDDDFVEAAANICDEFVQTLPVDHIVQSVDTTDDVLAVDGELLKFQTGDRVQVTSTGTLPTGISAATNYYVIIEKETSFESIKCEIKLASSYTNALAGTAINITAAGSGTHTVTKNGEPRYSASGVTKTVEENMPRDFLTDVLISMAGFAFKVGGKWLVFAGAYQSPSCDYDIDDIMEGGEVQYTPRETRRERFNAVRGVYISSVNYDQPDNYPAITSAVFEAEDGGERKFISPPFDLPLTYRCQTAQRLGKIKLSRHRRQGSVVLPLNITGMLCQPGNTITYTDEQFGWEEKTFEVIDHEFSSNADPDNPMLGVTILAREIDSAVYDFDYTSEEVNTPAPPSSRLPNPFKAPLPPASLTLNSGTDQLFVAGDGTVVSRIKATIGASPDGYVREYYIGYKKSADSVWQNQTIRAESTVHYLAPVEDGVSYDVRVASINQLGLISNEFIYAYNHVVTGKTEAPPRPDVFTISRLADGTRRFTYKLNSPPADVRVGGGFKIRYYLGTTSTWSAMTDLHDGVLSVSPMETNELAAGNYTFACKTVDSSGNESATAIFITAEIGNPRLRNALYQQIEQPTWPGTKTNCFVDVDGFLHALSDGDWTDLPATWNDLPNSWDAILTNNLTITYETAEIDLGINTTFMPLVSVFGTGTPTIEIKTGTTADGGVTGAYAAISGQVVGKRYIKIRVQMTHATAPVIESMTTILDGDVKIEEYADVDTAAETASWFESVAAGHFRIGSKEGEISALTFARITALQGVGAGWTWVLINKSSTVNGYPAAEFKIYDDTGTLADAVVDVELKGIT